MTSKHTPGPWRATTALGENLVAVYTVRDSDNFPVGRGFNAADTRLMAAAPHMLTVLRTLALHAPSLDAQGVRELCDEAIAKAEGRA
jgi:hypothetical protein